MQFKKQFALAVGIVALTSPFAAQAQQGYPYAPQTYQAAPSPLVTEGRLQASGCGLITRDFQRGTLVYGCPTNAQIQPQPGDTGPRCHYDGTAVRDHGYTAETRFTCDENVTDYDYSRRSQPQYGRDYQVAPDPYTGQPTVVAPDPRLVPYNTQGGQQQQYQRQPRRYNGYNN